MLYIMKEFDLHRINVEVALFAGPWLPSALERIGFVKEGRKREAIWFAKELDIEDRKNSRAHGKKIHSPMCSCGRRATVEVFNICNERCGLKCMSCGEQLIKSLNDKEPQQLGKPWSVTRGNVKGRWYDSLMYSMLRHEVEGNGT